MSLDTVGDALTGGGLALASDSSAGALVPPLVGDAKSSIKSTLTAMWPKTKQVLEVLRDQGLLLSILLGLSAFFSMAETSITTLWPWKVRILCSSFHAYSQKIYLKCLANSVTKYCNGEVLVR